MLRGVILAAMLAKYQELVFVCSSDRMQSILCGVYGRVGRRLVGLRQVASICCTRKHKRLSSRISDLSVSPILRRSLHCCSCVAERNISSTSALRTSTAAVSELLSVVQIRRFVAVVQMFRYSDLTWGIVQRPALTWCQQTVLRARL